MSVRAERRVWARRLLLTESSLRRDIRVSSSWFSFAVDIEYVDNSRVESF